MNQMIGWQRFWPVNQELENYILLQLEIMLLFPARLNPWKYPLLSSGSGGITWQGYFARLSIFLPTRSLSHLLRGRVLIFGRLLFSSRLDLISPAVSLRAASPLQPWARGQQLYLCGAGLPTITHQAHHSRLYPHPPPPSPFPSPSPTTLPGTPQTGPCHISLTDPLLPSTGEWQVCNRGWGLPQSLTIGCWMELRWMEHMPKEQDSNPSEGEEKQWVGRLNLLEFVSHKLCWAAFFCFMMVKNQ